MTHNSKDILSELILMTTSHINYAKQLLETPESKLQSKPSSKSWSALECLEHLNRYATFYNKEISKRMDASSLPFTETFKSTYLGNKFSNDMLPKEGMKTMNTFKSKNPNASTLDKEQVLLTFIRLQNELLTFLHAAFSKNLNKIKTYTTLPILKFKLGDTFRFVIFHNERHIVQAKKALVVL
ncbi:MAG: DinB family protein [Flavobacteriaceae bacterium]